MSYRRYLALAAFFLASCNRPTPDVANHEEKPKSTPTPTLEKKVSGQIFVVTPSSESVPLPIVSISVYPAEEIESYIESKASKSELVGNKLKQEYDKLVEMATKSDATDYPAFRQAHQARQQLLDSLERQSGKRQNLPKDSYEETEDQKKAFRDMRDSMGDDYAAWPTSDFYFSDLPKPAQVTTSDSAGRFTINVRVDRTYVIAAHASLKRADTLREFYWLVKYDGRNADGSAILLSNHNQTTSNDPSCVVICKSNHLVHADVAHIIQWK